MKRDMELVRRILLEVQSRTDVEPRKVEIEGIEQITLARHVEMLVEAEFLQGTIAKPSGSRNYPVVWVTDLSWAGHDFLGALENESVWSSIKQSFGAAELATMPLSVLKDVGVALLKEYAMGKVGLSGS